MAEKGELPLFQSTVPRENQQSRCSNPQLPNNPVGPLFIGKPPFNVAPKSCSNSSRRASTIHGSFQGDNAIPQCLSGRRRVTKLGTLRSYLTEPASARPVDQSSMRTQPTGVRRLPKACAIRSTRCFFTRMLGSIIIAVTCPRS